MSEVTFKMELAKDGYAKIEARIQAIENLADEGIFAYPSEDAPKKCQQIVLEAKKLRQVLRDVLFIAPAENAVSSGEGGAG